MSGGGADSLAAAWYVAAYEEDAEWDDAEPPESSSALQTSTTRTTGGVGNEEGRMLPADASSSDSEDEAMQGGGGGGAPGDELRGGGSGGGASLHPHVLYCEIARLFAPESYLEAVREGDSITPADVSDLIQRLDVQHAASMLDFNFRSQLFHPLHALYDPHFVPPCPHVMPLDNIHKASVLLPGGGASKVKLGSAHALHLSARDQAWREGLTPVTHLDKLALAASTCLPSVLSPPSREAAAGNSAATAAAAAVASTAHAGGPLAAVHRWYKAGQRVRIVFKTQRGVWLVYGVLRALDAFTNLLVHTSDGEPPTLLHASAHAAAARADSECSAAHSGANTHGHDGVQSETVGSEDDSDWESDDSSIVDFDVPPPDESGGNSVPSSSPDARRSHAPTLYTSSAHDPRVASVSSAASTPRNAAPRPQILIRGSAVVTISPCGQPRPRTR